MANEITRGNLVAAGLVALFMVPAMCTTCVNFAAPGHLGFTAPIVCPSGSRLVFSLGTNPSESGSGPPKHAYCVDAHGRDLRGDVYPRSFGLVYGVVLVLWGAFLVMVFRPRRGTAPEAPRVGDRPTAGL